MQQAVGLFEVQRPLKQNITLRRVATNAKDFFDPVRKLTRGNVVKILSIEGDFAKVSLMYFDRTEMDVANIDRGPSPARITGFMPRKYLVPVAPSKRSTASPTAQDATPVLPQAGTQKRTPTVSTTAKAAPASTSVDIRSFPPEVPMPDVDLSIIGSKEAPIRQSTGEGRMTTYVLENGTHYKIKIKNNGPVNVRGSLSIDGKDVGRWQYEPRANYEPIERPANVAKKFTFYTIRAVRAAESAVAASAEKTQSAEPATAGDNTFSKN